MVDYKLSYFAVRGLAETARQLFVLATVDFEDIRISKEEWPDHKASTPFGQVPVLEVDDKQLGQSKAIYRYLAKKFGFAGKDEWESALIDSWADQVNDFFGECRFFFPVLGGFAEGDVAKLYKELAEPARDKYFPLFVKQLKENKSGFLVGDKISWADLLLVNFIETLVDYEPTYLDKYPEIIAHLRKVHEIPEIKAWIEKRPSSLT